MKKHLAGILAMLPLGLALGQDIQAEKTISLKLASDIAAAAVADCASKGYNIVAVVVDRAGYMKAMQRADNARPYTIDIANRKAHTAAMMGLETRLLDERIKQGLTSATITQTPNFTAMAGGFPIKSGNEVIGGIGASGAPGGHLDAACVEAAFAKVQARLN